MTRVVRNCRSSNVALAAQASHAVFEIAKPFSGEADARAQGSRGLMPKSPIVRAQRQYSYWFTGRAGCDNIVWTPPFGSLSMTLSQTVRLEATMHLHSVSRRAPWSRGILGHSCTAAALSLRGPFARPAPHPPNVLDRQHVATNKFRKHARFMTISRLCDHG